jgi:aryl-alcohol dehydrogenase-like predicted oxidoreductase
MRPPVALGIGTAAFLAGYGLAPGDTPNDGLLRAAVRRGVRYLDTAADYGEGERAVARVLEPGVRACTKIPAGGTLDSIRTSIERLGATPDTVLMHSAEPHHIMDAPALDAMRQAKADGLTLRIGASTYGAEAASLAMAQPWCDTLQVEYSILNQSVVRSLSRLRDSQEVVVRSVLCKGLLTSRRAAAPALVAALADALNGLERCARDWNRSLEEMAIRFALDSPGIDVVLVGVSTPDELDTAICAAASPPLSAGQWAELAAFDRSDVDAAHPERWSRL